MDDLIRRQDALTEIRKDGKWLEEQGVTSMTTHERELRDTFILREMPSAQPNVHDFPKDADCISRQDAIGALIEWYGCEPRDIDCFKELLDESPSAQPEPSQVARDIAAIIENEQDMRVILKAAQPNQPPYVAEIESEYKKWEGEEK